MGSPASLTPQTLPSGPRRGFFLPIDALSYIVPDMNTDKWKSVLVHRWMYEEIVAIASIEGRTISGQIRFIFEEWKSRNLSDTDMRVVRAKIVELREAEREAYEARTADQEKERDIKILGIQALSPTRRFGK